MALFIKMHEFPMLCLRIKLWPFASSVSLAVAARQRRRGRLSFLKTVCRINVTVKMMKLAIV